jgi:hypothetical protein
MIAEME